MKKLLVPIDFSDVTHLVIRQARDLAKSLNGKIRLIHVAAPEPAFVGDDVGPQVIRNQKASKFREEHRQIQKLSEDLNKDGIETTSLLIQGMTVEEIIKESKRFGADLIVIGSHGHGAMYNLLMGSVVEGVIKKSKKPVLIVPANNL